MKNINLTLGAVVVSMLAGCSTTPQVLDRVGPAPPKEGGSISEGCLVVSSATETHPDGDGTYYYPHTSYHIYTPCGKRFKWVENHIGLNDESPTQVTIPAGDYDVHALSDFGSVIVPVLIAAGKTTEVTLDTSGANRSRDTNDISVVWQPKGPSKAYYKVGWRAKSPTNAETK